MTMSSLVNLPSLPKQVMDILHGFCASQSLFTACELGIFDVLDAAGGPQTAGKIAEQLSTNQDATSRLLDVLVSLELLEKQNDAAVADEPVYSNSPLAYCLTKSSQTYLNAFVNHIIKTEGPLTNNLTSAVCEGTDRWKKTFDISFGDVFKNLFNNHENLMLFLEGMRGLVKPTASVFLSAFDLSRFKKMCDLGGCTGDIAYAACMAYPNMKITVLDLPPVVQNAPHFRPSMDECPNQQNVTFVAEDFFEPTLPAADLYVLTHVLHDWGEAKIDALLSNVYKNLPSGGGLLIGELLLKEDKTGPLVGVLASLTMLVLCDKGARERSGQEYKQLLERHGFVDVEYKYTGNSLMDAVFCRKP